MGTWGIARDMAKINEENLSKLSRKGMYERMKDYNYSTKRKIYTFKKAKPEILKAIKIKRQAENKSMRRKHTIIGVSCILFGIILFWIAMTF